MRRRLRAEGGMTIVEVMVAALMLAVIAAAAAAFFTTGNHSALASQRQSQLLSMLDQQMQVIRQNIKLQGFNKLAMSANPQALPSGFPASSYTAITKADPNAFVSPATGCGSSNQQLLLQANYDNTGEGIPSGYIAGPSPHSVPMTAWTGCSSTSSSLGEPLEIHSATGFVNPQQTLSFTSGGGTETAVIDAYVTDTYIGCNTSFSSQSCPTVSNGTVTCASGWPSATASTPCGDVRRVVLVAVLNDHRRYNLGPSAPVYVTSVFANPTPSNEPTSSLGLSLGVQIG